MKLKEIILSLMLSSTLSCGEMKKEDHQIQDLVDRPVTGESYQNQELKDAFDSDEYLQLGFKKDTYSNGQNLWGYIFKFKGEKTIFADSKMNYHKNIESVLKRVEERIGKVPPVLIIDNDFNNDGKSDLSDEEIAKVYVTFKPERVVYLNN